MKKSLETNELDINKLKLEENNEIISLTTTATLLKELGAESKSPSLPQQFHLAVSNLNLKRALEIVKDPDFYPNQYIKSYRITGTEDGSGKYETIEIEETPLHMVTDLDFESENSVIDNSLVSVAQQSIDRDILEEDLYKIVTSLIEQSASIDAIDSRGNTPLLNAVNASHLETARLLLEEGANLHLPNKDGLRALDAAIRSGNLDLINLVLSQEKFLLITKETIEGARRPESDELLVRLTLYLLEQLKSQNEIINDLVCKNIHLENAKKEEIESLHTIRQG